jgi:predicted O-methyltransferase YrrM
MNEHGVHSPFVYDLVTNVIYNDKDYYAYKAIEALREKLQASNTVKGAKHSFDELKPAKYNQLLFRLVNHFQPQHILEIGNSLGIETAYMASAKTTAEIVKLEESSEFAEVEKDNFKQLKLNNIRLIHDPEMTVLPSVLKKIPHLDFVYINQQSKRTVLNCFYQSLEKVNEQSVFVIANLYASSEIKDAWTEIKNNTQVKVTIDLFHIGIVFFRKEQVKEHFLIRF